MPLAMDTRPAASFSVLQRGAASQIVVQGWDGTYLPRPSHDDGTFTRANSLQLYCYTTILLHYYVTIETESLFGQLLCNSTKISSNYYKATVSRVRGIRFFPN